ncbi:DUF1877 family protein [Sphingomonas echinoides]|uniref:DUF1877 family protein n=1 Tax=Sphingomonas echinoides TaxID=59803 RepID=A0ABU4PS38_9SPHN|nr:DUF1877 family protein [Sphingomonas echinoides]MDX5985958.1 DUF1877 family protein [Sphingomonas echinoides]
MGMVMYLRRASPSDIAALRRDPSEVQKFAFEDGDVEADLIEFDKAWHALHFMLTGAAYDSHSPLGIIADIGEAVSQDVDGLDEFWIISPEEMQAFDTAFRQIDDAALSGRYDNAAMLESDIYLADAFADDGDELALEYILQGVPALRRLSAACAAAGDGAVRILA